jgi:hypothetical protein
MPGLISNAIDTTNPNVVQGALTSNYDATTRTVDPKTQTVAGQLNDLLSSGSPYLESAKAGALQAGNARGLLNSSMTASAGQKAAIDAALPIATADANTYNTTAAQNQAFQNTAGQFNAGAANTSNLQASQAANQATLQATAGTQQQTLQAQKADIDKQLQQIAIQAQTGLTAQQAQIQKDLTAQQADLQSKLSAQQAGQTQETQAQAAGQTTELQTLRGTQAQALADTEAAYKNLLQSSASATSIFNQVSTNISAILNDATTDAATKQALLANQQDLLKSGLAIVGGIGNLDLNALLDFTAGTNPLGSAQESGGD